MQVRLTPFAPGEPRSATPSPGSSRRWTRAVSSSPGAASNAFPLMREAALAALDEALVADLRGDVEIEAIAWEEDLILRGTIARALHSLDTEVFAETGVSALQMPVGG